MLKGNREQHLDPIPKGMIVILTCNTHDNYRRLGIFRALRDIDTKAILDEWIANPPEWQKRRNRDYFKLQSIFINELIRDGYFEEIHYAEWHTGCMDYPDVEDMTVSAPQC